MILGIIPARKGSKRLPGKNTRMLCGKPLIAWTIEAALCSGKLDRVIVSTDDDEAADVADRMGCEVAMRPDFLATDTASVYDVVRFHLKNTDADHVMLLQPTSPLRTAADIDDMALDYVCEERPHPTQSRAIGDTKANGAMYIAPTDDWWRDRNFNFDTTGGALWYDMPPERSIDINELADFEACERYMNSMKPPK